MRGVKPDAEGLFLSARVNKRAERGQIDILKGNDVKEARNCKLRWEKKNVAYAVTRAEYFGNEGGWESHQLSLKPDVRCSGRSYNRVPLAYSRLPPGGAWTAAEFNARSERQWTQMFNIWLWVELILLCDGRLKTQFRFRTILPSRCLERTM
jgi:hypothetical protein